MRSARAARMTLSLSLLVIDDEPRVPVLLSVVVVSALVLWAMLPLPDIAALALPDDGVSLLTLPSVVAALRPVIEVVVSGLTAALPMLPAVGV